MIFCVCGAIIVFVPYLPDSLLVGTMPRGKYGSRKKPSKSKRHRSTPAPIDAEVRTDAVIVDGDYPNEGVSELEAAAAGAESAAVATADSAAVNWIAAGLAAVESTVTYAATESAAELTTDEMAMAEFTMDEMEAEAATSTALEPVVDEAATELTRAASAAESTAAVAEAESAVTESAVTIDVTATESTAAELAAVKSAVAELTVDETAAESVDRSLATESVAHASAAAESAADQLGAASAAESPYESCDSEPADTDCEPDEDFELSMERGCGVCVVRAAPAEAEGARFELDEAALESILARAHVPAARPIVLISVAGAFRGGKSFLLDFFLRYLYAEESERANGSWLGAPEEPLRGFSWRGGCAPETRGLVLWSQPFPVTLSDGQEVSLLLLDTQGSFDADSSLRDCSLVFAVSTLLASVQVYNISQRIDESDLRHLQMFTEAAEVTGTGRGGGALPALQLVVRDWSAPGDYPPGAAGGARYLADKLQVREEQPAEVRDVRERLTRSFEHVSCCLLPHPGLRAAAHPDFNGQLADLTEDFKDSLREFVPLLLAPSRLRVKTVGGRAMRAEDLAVHVRAYLDTFREYAPSPCSVARALAVAGWLTAVRDARGVLREDAPARDAPAVARAPLRARLAAACRAALAPLPALAARAGDEAGLADIEQELHEQVTQYLDINETKIALGVAEGKEEWERGVHALREPAVCAPARELRALAAAACAAALSRYDRRVADRDEPERARLIEELESRSSDLLNATCAVSDRTVAAVTRTAVAALRSALPPTPRHPATVAPAHAAAAAHARQLVRAVRTLPAPIAGPDPHLARLDAQIEEIFREHQAQNAMDNERAVRGALQVYDGAMALGTRCRHPAGLATAHLRALERARAVFVAARRGARADVADQYSEELETSIQNRYEFYMECNVRNNKASVEAALGAFCKHMDHCSVLRLSAENLEASFEAAESAAVCAFRAKRICVENFGIDDTYFNQLKQKMFQKRIFYQAKNNDKPTAWDIAGPGLGLAATVGLGFLRILR